MDITLTNEIIFWILLLVAILAIIDAVCIVFLSEKIKRLLGGTDAASISDGLAHIRKELNELKEFRTELEAYLKQVELRLKRSVQSVETVRFNPFKGTGDGGNQSFSTALIDQNGDGVVVSGLYSRERVSVFSKPVKKFASTFELTEEEQEVIDASKKKVS
jgi:hypothetical protein